MGKRLQRPNQQGIALLTALIIIVIAVLLLGALTMRIINQSRQVDQQLLFEQCFQGLEAALTESVGNLEAGGDGLIGLDNWEAPESEGQLVLPELDDDGVEPKSLGTLPGVRYIGYVQQWGNDGIDNLGDGTVDGANEQGMFAVYSIARSGSVLRRAEAIFQGVDVSVWNNAIFAGSGHADGTMRGNASIHGSVHILGDNVVAGGETMVLLDMTGASLIHNNYGVAQGGGSPGPALSQRLLDSVPPLPTASVNGETVETLNAVVRARRGLISLNGSAEIGRPEQAGNGVKDTMDAVYNQDGWTGNKVSDDGDRGDPSCVFSDNGWDEGYDLGEAMRMPALSDDWRWPGRYNCYELGYEYSPSGGATEPSDDGDNYRHDEFFSDVLSDGNAYNGDVALRAKNDFYLNLTRPGDTNPANRVKSDPATCTAGDDYLYYKASSKVLEINGQIEIDGDFEIVPGNGSSGRIVYYTGRAALLVRGDVILNTSLLSCNDGNPNNYALSFPERNCLGIMAGGSLTLGTNAQLEYLGAFYAQGQISSAKQTVVMGTFVSNFFDMGNQVPDIYQVPALSTNLPLGMIGNWPVFVVDQLSWREL